MPIFGQKNVRYTCQVLLLDNTVLKFEVNNKTFGDELIGKVSHALDILEKEYFGLRYKGKNGNSYWLDPHKLVKRQVYNGNETIFQFYFGIKYYVADPTRLREEITRYQFFLQVKQDILLGRITCELQNAAELCAYAVQSELGDYDAAIHNEGFISEFQFVPHQTEELEDLIVENYKKLRGLQPCEAESKYLDRARRLEMYGVDVHPVKGQDEMDYLLGLSPSGIVLFKNKNRIGNFIWPKITKLKYKSNTFILRATQGRSDEEKEYTFICKNKDYAKSLWKHCAEHHTFFRLDRGSDFPSSANNFIFKKNSTFKFTGRTQQEIERDIDSHPRTQPSIRRVPSQRYSRRSQGFLSPDERKTTNLLSSSDGGPMSPLSGISDISAPWEAVFSEQSGLYSNGQQNSYPSRKGGTSDDNRRRTSGYHSSGEAEQKRKRSQYYSGYTSGGGNSTAEFRSINNRHSGSAPNVTHKQSINSHYNTHSYKTPRHHRHSHTSSLHGDQSDRMMEYEKKYRPSGTKSDSEEMNQLRRHQLHRQKIAGGNQSESELVAPLDVYHNSVGMGVPNEEHQRRHVKRHHHHHHRKQQGRHSAYQFDPNQATVLLELGPNTSTPSAYVPVHTHSASFDNKENIHDTPPPYGVTYQYAGDVNAPAASFNTPGSAPHQYIHNYLPPHLLKKGRSPGGVNDTYSSTQQSRIVRGEGANYNVSTEL